MLVVAMVSLSACPSLLVWLFRDFTDTVYPFFESDTLFLEFMFVLFLVVSRFFESRDV